ncbi:MAG: hypothetical protein OEQ39_14950 [Gammaproteobacteria bacterium]|nr:hypothetical protein [Gammaproteobacteria bacterium]MDH3465069.1 hypothetical protein [Gammaproteobacteria bacterium]
MASIHGRTAGNYVAEFEIAQAADVLFPLFSPEGEKLWMPGWDYENIMGRLELNEDDVFVTTSHDHAVNAVIWIVKKYCPETYEVQLYRVEAEEKVGLVAIKCHPLGRNSTKVRVAYTYIGLSERGRRFIENFTEEAYQEFIEEWRTLLIEYFANKL